ncbi:hypothetical protein C9374_014041 [Naegleria lovaniensis]|uniref:B30.2/SPRY domain-containing protein n=1 Tax=Naegleria lovaniensis TaxID=51637 RepID=A0AA88H0K0_NAELO|nr:uncharacterized protein C9374_014041 [Naegleria lovaniensis]KAG2389481.1 hypothetical protein C9374_014041 [Naegleria lovaniensis]
MQPLSVVTNNNNPLDAEKMMQDDDLEILYGFECITNDVIEHDIIPFVDYHSLITVIPLVSKTWYHMANKVGMWFTIVCKECGIHAENLSNYVTCCKINNIRNRNSTSWDSYLFDEDLYILKRLYYTIRKLFPTKLLTPNEDTSRQFRIPDLITRDPNNPHVLIFNNQRFKENTFGFDLNLMSDKRIPNLLFLPTPKPSLGESTESHDSAPQENTVPDRDISQLVPVYYFEVGTMELDSELKTPTITSPTTPLSSASTFSPNISTQKSRRVFEKKEKRGRNSIGVLHACYQTRRQVGWDECGAGFHSDDGKVFVAEGGSDFDILIKEKKPILGDTLGCGVLANNGQGIAFFTLNGRFMASPFTVKTTKEDMRFGLGFWKNEKVVCNFGQIPFQYNITNVFDDVERYLGDHPVDNLPALSDSGYSYERETVTGLLDRLSTLRLRLNRASEHLNMVSRAVRGMDLSPSWFESDEEFDDNAGSDYQPSESESSQDDEVQEQAQFSDPEEEESSYEEEGQNGGAEMDTGEEE